jgi:hypothetical protein
VTSLRAMPVPPVVMISLTGSLADAVQRSTAARIAATSSGTTALCTLEAGKRLPSEGASRARAMVGPVVSSEGSVGQAAAVSETAGARE